jgi:hypothetical protein
MYGYANDIAQFQAPSISVDPSNDILYLSSMTDRQFEEIIILYADYFREAKYIAMDNDLAVRFIWEILPRKPNLEAMTPGRWKLFEKLTDVFLVSQADGFTMDSDGCQGVMEFERWIEEESFAEFVQKLGLTFKIYHVRRARLSQCSPGICRCTTEAEIERVR